MSCKNVRPNGWLLESLHTQMQGLTGHIQVAGFPYDRQFWGAETVPPSKVFWWPFEQTAYHMDGYVRVAALLRNGAQLAKARRMIHCVIDHPDSDGYLGPAELKEAQGKCDRWPHVVFFRACLALYEYDRDPKIIDALTRHYLGYPVDHSVYRNALNIEIMLALYGINGNRQLLDMAVSTYEKAEIEQFLGVNDDPLAPVHIHGVTYNEFAKLGALLYQHTGEEKYLRCSIAAYQKAAALYMLPGGCVSSDEYMRSNHYYDTYETCDIADMTWSLQYLARITDDGSYSDMIERCVFNAGMGSVLEDFKALQYFSCANQLVTDQTSSHAFYMTGNGAMRYAPKPFTECCTGNVNRILPNYIRSLWDQQGSVITARMYGPSAYQASGISIAEETNYPFDLSAQFDVRTKVPFTLRLRIPRWCTHFRLEGAPYRQEGDFALVDLAQDTRLSLSMDAAILQHQNGGGVYFTRGPLVYSLGMKGHRIPTGNRRFPEYAIAPDRPWNYAIVGNGNPVFTPGAGTKWDLDFTLPTITVDARQVESWKLTTVDSVIAHKYEPFEMQGRFTLLPPLPDMPSAQISRETCRITLYPYGACKVRMTVLPCIPSAESK